MLGVLCDDLLDAPAEDCPDQDVRVEDDPRTSSRYVFVLRRSCLNSSTISSASDSSIARAGALLGARWGASAIPAQWRRISHGYPGLTGERLVELAHLAACGGRPGAYGWPAVDHIDCSGHGVPTTLVRHPLDDGVWLADASALSALPDDVTAVVSLCLVGRQQIRPDLVHQPSVPP